MSKAHVTFDLGTPTIIEGLPLQELNENIRKLVDEINTLLLHHFANEEAQKELDLKNSIKALYIKQKNSHIKELTSIRDKYVGLLNKAQSELGTRDNKKLYKELHKKYASKAKASKRPILDVQEWDIPALFKPSEPKPPKLPAGRSRLAVQMAARVFRLKNFYRAHTHMSRTRAQAHYARLIEVHRTLCEKDRLEQTRANELDAEKEKVTGEIDSLHNQLMHPPNHIWQDALKVYQDSMKQILATLDGSIDPYGKDDLTERGVATAPISKLRKMSDPLSDTVIRYGASIPVPKHSAISGGFGTNSIRDVRKMFEGPSSSFLDNNIPMMMSQALNSSGSAKRRKDVFEDAYEDATQHSREPVPISALLKSLTASQQNQLSTSRPLLKSKGSSVLQAEDPELSVSSSYYGDEPVSHTVPSSSFEPLGASTSSLRGSTFGEASFVSPLRSARLPRNPLAPP